MSLSRAERFRLKSGILDVIASSDSDWDLRRQNVLLAEFGLPPLDWDGPTFGEQLGAINERDLLEMYGIVLGVDLADVRADVEDSDAGNWKPGYVRLFVSHSARHKEFVGEIADELAVAGIHGFVAHDTMEYSKPWQAQIEQALRSMQAFVALVHPEFNDSAWCQQEVGWAFGRRVPRYAVRLGRDPAGFIGSDQWPSGHGQTAKQVAHAITSWVAREEGLGSSMVEGLFNALRSAGNYYDAEAAAARIAALGNLTSEQWAELEDIFWQNDQIYGSVLANRALRPLFDQNRRPFPPTQPPPF